MDCQASGEAVEGTGREHRPTRTDPIRSNPRSNAMLCRRAKLSGPKPNFGWQQGTIQTSLFFFRHAARQAGTAGGRAGNGRGHLLILTMNWGCHRMVLILCLMMSVCMCLHVVEGVRTRTAVWQNPSGRPILYGTARSRCALTAVLLHTLPPTCLRPPVGRLDALHLCG